MNAQGLKAVELKGSQAFKVSTINNHSKTRMSSLYDGKSITHGSFFNARKRNKTPDMWANSQTKKLINMRRS